MGKRDSQRLAAIAILLAFAFAACALTTGPDTASAQKSATATKKSPAAKKLNRQRSLLQRKLRKNPGLLKSSRFMKAAVRFKLALPGELRIPQCSQVAGQSVGGCLILRLDAGNPLRPRKLQYVAWGRLPITVAFLGGRPYGISLEFAPVALVTDDSPRLTILESSAITGDPVGVPGDQSFGSNGCSDILGTPGYLAADAFAAGGAAAFAPIIDDTQFSTAYRLSVMSGNATVDPFRRSAEGKLDFRMNSVSIFREMDNDAQSHCLNIATGVASSDFSLTFKQEPALTHDFAPAADGTLKLAKVELTHSEVIRPDLLTCVTSLMPADVNLSVVGWGDFSGIPPIAWSTPCNAPVPSLNGTNPLFGNTPAMPEGSATVTLRPNLSIGSVSAELVLLPGGYVPKTG